MVEGKYDFNVFDDTVYYRATGKVFTKRSYKKQNNKDMENTIKIGEEVIDLNLPFPREMEVRTESSDTWKTRTVICVSSAGHTNNAVAICNGNTKFSSYHDLAIWKYCREIPKKKQMTVAEIEAKLGHRVEVISKD